jgi:predicted porin
MKTLAIQFATAVFLTAFCGAVAHAQDRLSAPAQSGFYGGVSLNDRGAAATGINFAGVSSSWAKYGSVMAEDNGTGALLYGGYQFANDVAVEAAFGRSDGSALALARPGMGLALASPGDVASRRWNVDLYTSYKFGAAFALYGRVGYLQNEALPAYLLVNTANPHPQQGVNYGVGLRYDMSPTLGLKLEYARFGRLAFDTFSGAFPESDQVQIGVQYRF